MPKTEGDEVEYVYMHEYHGLGGALVATTTKSQFRVAIETPREDLETQPVEDLADALAHEIDYSMNQPSRDPDPSAPESPELGVQIDREKIRAALETALPARRNDAKG